MEGWWWILIIVVIVIVIIVAVTTTAPKKENKKPLKVEKKETQLDLYKVQVGTEMDEMKKELDDIKSTLSQKSDDFNLFRKQQDSKFTEVGALITGVNLKTEQIFDKLNCLHDRQVADQATFCAMYEKIECAVGTAREACERSGEIEEYTKKKIRKIQDEVHELEREIEDGKKSFTTGNLVIDSTDSSSSSLIEFVNDNDNSRKNLFNFNSYGPSYSNDSTQSISPAFGKTLMENSTALLLKCNINTVVNGVVIKNEPYYLRLLKVE